MDGCLAVSELSKKISAVIFQCSVALINELICVGSLEGTTSCAHRLLVCYVVTFLDVTSTIFFYLVWSSSGRYLYVIASLYCFL
jgi:hypothetical protein